MLAGYAYTYNTVNDRLTRTETVNGTSTTQNYGYDPIDQVTSVNYGTGRNQGFAYDFVGNRQQVTDTAATVTPASYTTNNLNQYTTVTSQPAALSYDKNGNLLNASGYSYGYDSQNRLISGSGAGNSEVLAYDPRDRCVCRTLNGSSTFFIFDGWSSLAEYNPSGGLQTKYINGAQIDEKLAVLNTGSTPLYFLQDGLGSNTALTDLNGNVLERYLYDVYGKVSITNGLGQSQSASNYGNRYLFTGREFLFKLNLYDYRNRFYSADLGRWLERDPLKNAEMEQGPNLYEYVGNNPVVKSDPFGLMAPRPSSPTPSTAQKPPTGNPNLDPGDREIQCEEDCFQFCKDVPCPSECVKKCVSQCMKGDVPSPTDAFETPSLPRPNPSPKNASDLAKSALSLLGGLFK